MTPQEEEQTELVSSITRNECWIGAYALLIRFAADIRLCVGRFCSGEPILVPKGRYLYVGSAMGGVNGLYLPKRLLRHARRSADQPSHDCYHAMMGHFIDQGVSRARLDGQSPKKLRWNIDYMMDHDAAELEAVAYIRSAEHLEFAIVEGLEEDSSVCAPYPGFGAHDHPGHSHLFAASDAFFWHEFVAELTSRFERT